MPIDPRHGKNIPAGTVMARTLTPFLAREYRRVRSRWFSSGICELSRGFETELMILLSGIVADHYRTGKRIASRMVRERALVRKSLEIPSMGYEFGVNSTVERAANQLAFDLAGGISDGLRDRMRDTLGNGLANGFSATEIAEAFEPFFGRHRAETIAVTEASRAQHAGEMDTYLELGIKHHAWLASSDACDLCSRMDGIEVEIGQAFYEHGSGRSSYRVVKHPPMHPVCKCSIVPVFT